MPVYFLNEVSHSHADSTIHGRYITSGFPPIGLRPLLKRPRMTWETISLSSVALGSFPQSRVVLLAESSLKALTNRQVKYLEA